METAAETRSATAPTTTLALSRPITLAGGLALAVLAFGAAVRLVRYLADRSFWLDESYLAINLMTRSYGELLQTLDYNQGAPIGFLWSERLALGMLGDSELALRLVPLLVGLASLPLFYLVARRLLGPAAVVVALLLFATMEPFVRYSAEMKQYGFDVAVALALVYLFLRLDDAREFGRAWTIALAIAGPLAVWLSHPSVFVLAGFAAAGLFTAGRRRDRPALVRQAAAYGVWLAAFAVAYLVAVKDLEGVQQSARGIGAGAGGKLKNLYTIFNDPGLLPRTAVGLAAAVTFVGAVSLWRRRPGFVVLLASGTAALLLAGFLELYPIGQRFLLFLLPLLVLCLAEGVVAIAQQAPRPLAAALVLAVAALILAPAVGTAAERLVAPPDGEEIEPLLGEVAANWRPGDVLYLYPDSQYAFRYYVECEDCSSLTTKANELWPSHPTAGGQAQTTAAIVSDSPSLVVGEYGNPLAEHVAGRERAWLLYTHFFPRTEEDLLAEADDAGTRIRCTHGGASLLCLYDFS